VPIAPIGQPEQGEASSIGGPLGFGVVRLIEDYLLSEEEVFSGQGRPRAQAQPEQTHPIRDEYQRHVRER
jgi:hypothetical protein